MSITEKLRRLDDRAMPDFEDSSDGARLKQALVLVFAPGLALIALATRRKKSSQR